MKILCIPLDERPCNVDFVNMIGDTNEKITLFSPSKDILGDKKRPANIEAILKFISEHSNVVDAMVISLDMLFYGGLIPSRLHHLTKVEVEKRVAFLQTLKKENPKIKIYAFNCIMRAPSYNSSEEEPEYYEQYGYSLFRKKYLEDKKERVGISKVEQLELENIMIPREVLVDYENRRDFNTDINIQVVRCIKQGVLDFLVIPQDDSSPYGYTAISQKKVIAYTKKYQLDEKVMIYPGADEVAMSLLARAYNEHYHKTIRIYPIYSSTLGPQIIPKYEDRPMQESLKSHVRVIGGRIVASPDNADLILGINSPGKVMQESFEAKDLTYTTYRQLLDFVLTLEEYNKAGHRIAICDSAFSNGGDVELISYLDQHDLLTNIVAYAGWNTNCNSLGTVLSQSVIGTNHSKVQYHVIYRILEDVFYQAIIRLDIVENILPTYGITYYDFKDQQEVVEENIALQLVKQYQKLQISKLISIDSLNVWMPWKRMFEIGMELSLEEL